MDQLVLLVTPDDTEAQADFFAVVADIGLRLQRIGDPRVAYASVEKEIPALIILDLDHRTGDAMEFIAWLRDEDKLTSSIPVIGLTREEHIRKHASHSGLDVTVMNKLHTIREMETAILGLLTSR